MVLFVSVDVSAKLIGSLGKRGNAGLCPAPPSETDFFRDVTMLVCMYTVDVKLCISQTSVPGKEMSAPYGISRIVRMLAVVCSRW